MAICIRNTEERKFLVNYGICDCYKASFFLFYFHPALVHIQYLLVKILFHKMQLEFVISKI